MKTRTATFTLFHRRAKQKQGHAVSFRLFPAVSGKEGYITVTVAKQIEDSLYDWSNAAQFQLNFFEISKIVQVMRGEKEEERLYDPLNDVSVIFKHILWDIGEGDRGGYRATIDKNSTVERFVFEILDFEATGLCVVFEQALFSMAFGVMTREEE